MAEYTVKDSGERQTFPTGAMRDIQKGKGRYDLIPAIFLRRLAKLLEAGAVKYGDSNWMKGIPTPRLWDSCMRHINNAREGVKTGEDDKIQAVFNLMCLVVFDEIGNPADAQPVDPREMLFDKDKAESDRAFKELVDEMYRKKLTEQKANASLDSLQGRLT